MSGHMIMAVLPQFRAMIAELETRPNTPKRVIDAAHEFIASLEEWATAKEPEADRVKA